MTAATSVVNVYGLEVWSGSRRDVAWGLSASDHVISDCHQTARYVEAEKKRREGSTAVVLDCVDLERFAPGAANPRVLERDGVPSPSSGFNILSLGRLKHAAAHKGYDRLLEAFARVATGAPEVRLVFGGSGEIVAELRVRADAIGVSSRVFLTGAIHDDDLPHIFRAAHVFSLISDRGKRRGEGIPLTPLGAAACGIPILVGNQVGSQDAVVECANGYILDPFDLDSLTTRIERLLREPERLARLGRAASSRIEQEFSFTNFRDKHRALSSAWCPGGRIGVAPTETRAL